MAKDVAIVQAQRLSGNVGDVLTKTENGVKWQAPQGGSGVPDGGEENDVLARDVDGGLKWMPLQDGWTVDSELDVSSSNPVQNRAVANALADKQGKLPHGSAGLFLRHGSGSDSYSWAAALPDGGAPGDVLTRIGEAGIGWAALDAGSPTGLIDSELDASSSNPVKNKAIYAGLELKQDKLPGGDTGKYLRMTGGGPAWLDASWSGVATGLPAGGTKGQVLARTSDSYAWIDALELQDGNVNDVLTLTGNGPAWAPLPDVAAGDVSGEAVRELASKLDLNGADIRGGARIYIGKNKNLDTRSDSVPEIDFLHTKDAMLGHEYCAVFTSEAIDQDIKPSAAIFPWVPWPVEDGEWSSSESSLSISDPWADHPNMGEGTYECTFNGVGATTYPNLKGTGYAYTPAANSGTAIGQRFYLGEPSVDSAQLYGKWTKHVALVIDESTHYGNDAFYGEYKWDPSSARYLCDDVHKKIIPMQVTTGAYSWAAVDMSDPDVFPAWTEGTEGALAVDPPALRRVVWERVVDDKYVYRTVLRPDKNYSVAVADVCTGHGGGSGGSGGGSGAGGSSDKCNCSAELDAIRAELLMLWALHQLARLTVVHSPGAAPEGAAWDVDSDSDWHAFGETATVDAGTHSVGFKPLLGHVAPDSQSVSIGAGSAMTVSAAYDSQPGVTVNAYGDVPSGAFWSIAPASAPTDILSYAYGSTQGVAPGQYVIRPSGYGEYDTAADGFTWDDTLTGFPVTVGDGAGLVVDITYTAKAQPPATPAAYSVQSTGNSVTGTFTLEENITTTYNGVQYPVYKNGSTYLAMRSNGRPAINGSADGASTYGWIKSGYTAGAEMTAESLSGEWANGPDNSEDELTFTEVAG